jgi:hypothetical protein
MGFELRAYMLAIQVLYHLSYSTSFFFCNVFFF